jgi:outer membrane protein TolC
MVPVFLVCYGLVAQTPSPAVASRLSLKEAIQIALKNNLQVSIAEQARESTRAGVTISEGAFDWNLAANAQMSHTKSGYSTRSGAPTTGDFTTTSRSLGADINKLFAWGGTVDVQYSPAYNYTKAVVAGVSNATSTPYTGSLSASYTQSLLRNFGVEATTANLVVSRKNAEAADYTFQLAIINLVAATETQYWELVYAERNLVNKQAALELARKQLRENTIRVQVGTMAPIEVTSAEAQVAQAEQDIIATEAAVLNAKDALIRALYPNAERPASLEPSDGPTLGHIQLDEAAAVKMALDRRVELKAARIGKDIYQIQEYLAINKLKPQLDAFVAYNGAADTYGAIGPVNSDLTGMKYPGYTVGLKFAVPLQNRAAKGGLSQARANRRSSELGLRDQELSITLLVRTAIRNVEATEKGVKAAEKTRYYQEKNLEAEQKKFENGMSTNFVVLQVMTNLDNAKSAELLAQIAYAKAVTNLELQVGNLMQARNLTIK